jgi:hypothetical protein
MALRSLVGFSRLQQVEVETDLTELKVGGQASSADIRVLFAVATMMWRDVQFDKQAQLLKVMREACVDTRRNEEARLPGVAVLGRDAYLVDTGKAVAAAFLDDAPSSAHR